MAIHIDEKNRIFTLHTLRTTYQMNGARTDDGDLSQLIYHMDRGFSGNPYEKGKTDKGYSLDVLPQEYSCFGTGDYRVTALRVRNADGSRAADLRPWRACPPSTPTNRRPRPWWSGCGTPIPGWRQNCCSGCCRRWMSLPGQ